jgi:hypothetical protein
MMPSSSKKQHNFMEAIAHSPSFAKKVGVPQSVGKDFSTADKGKTFKRGGEMATKMNPGFMAMMAKKKGAQEGSKADMASDKKQMMGMKKGGMKKMAAGGFTREADGIASKGKTKAKQIVMSGNKGMKKGGMC